MTDTHNLNENNHSKEIKHYALMTAKVIGAVMFLALLVHVSWNMFAPTMFGLATIKMKQALGIVVFTGVLAFIFRHGKHRHSRTKAA